MSTKDFKKGMVAGAKPFGDKLDQLADVSESAVANIKEGLDGVSEVVNVVLDDVDVLYEEHVRKQRLHYGLCADIDISFLPQDKKEILISVLYTLISQYNQNSATQKDYFFAAKHHLQVSSPVDNFDFALIDEIDSKNERTCMLQIVCEFLFLNNNTCFFLEKFEDLIDYFGLKQSILDTIIGKIEHTYAVLGERGVLERFSPAEDSEVYAEETYIAPMPVETNAVNWDTVYFCGLKHRFPYSSSEKKFARKPKDVVCEDDGRIAFTVNNYFVAVGIGIEPNGSHKIVLPLEEYGDTQVGTVMAVSEDGVVYGKLTNSDTLPATPLSVGEAQEIKTGPAELWYLNGNNEVIVFRGNILLTLKYGGVRVEFFSKTELPNFCADYIGAAIVQAEKLVAVVDAIDGFSKTHFLCRSAEEILLHMRSLSIDINATLTQHCVEAVLEVEDVLSIKDRGTVVTGLISANRVTTGETVFVNGMECELLGIETDGKIVTYATKGTFVGLLLNVRKTDVGNGMLVIRKTT